MPGLNLTRDEAAERADILDVATYDISLDLTTSEVTFASTTVITFSCSEVGASTFVDLVGATVHEITLNGDADRPVGVRRQPDRADRPAGRQRARGRRRLHLQPQRRGSAPLRRPGRQARLPLHPVRGARRPPRVRHLRAARPQGRLHLPRHRAVALAGRVQLPDARARRGSASGASVWHFEPTKPMSTYITALVAGDYAVVRDTYHGTPRRHPARHLRPPVAARAPRRRRHLRGHQAGLRVLRERLRHGLPVRQVRPAVRAGVQHGRDGERRLRDVPRRVHLPQPPDPGGLRRPGQHDPARDGAHVVRRPRHDEVVGRPLAQRVVRRVGRAPGRRPTRPSTTRRGPTSATPARPGPTARTSCRRRTRSPPTTTTSRPSRSTSTASPTPRAPRPCGSSWPGSARTSSSPACAPTSTGTPTATPSSIDLLKALEETSGRELGSWTKEWLQTSGVNTVRPVFEVDADGRFTSFVDRADRARRSSRPCAGTGSRSASTT